MRVLSQQGFLKAIGRSRTAKGGEGASVDEGAAFLRAKNLKPFVSNKLATSTRPIVYKPIKGGSTLVTSCQRCPSRISSRPLTLGRAGSDSSMATVAEKACKVKGPPMRGALCESLYGNFSGHLRSPNVSMM